MTYWVYILASKPGGTLYAGVTNDLAKRVYEHREGLVDGFTKRYGVKTLVYFEAHETIAAALQRELHLVNHSPPVLEVFELLNVAAFFGDPLIVAAPAAGGRHGS